MAQFTGKFLKVWKVEEQNGFRKLNLGDSIKNKEGNYDSFTWFGVALFGKAKDVEINEGDVVEVKSGIIYQEKYQDKWYTRLKVFDIEVTKKFEGNVKNSDGFVPIDDDLDSSLPF
jgi:hypothetical protein